MGSDWAKNCTSAAIRNSDSSRTLSLAILLIVYFQRSGSSGPFAIDLKRRDYPSPAARARISPYHVGATRPLRKVTGVMSLFSEGRGGNVRTGTQSTHLGNSGLSHKNVDQKKGRGRHGCRSGNGDQPRPHNSRRYAPAHRRQSLDRTHAHNGPSNGVGCADRDSGQGSREQSDGPGALGAKTPNRFQLRDLLPHRVHDAPASEISSGGNGGIRGEGDGPGQASPVTEHVLLAHEPGSIESAGDDAHGFLRVVAAVSQAVAGSREQLQFAEPLVNLLGRFVSQQPINGDHEPEAHDQSHDGRDHNEDQGLVPPGGDDHRGSRTPAGMKRLMRHGGTRVSTN